MRQWVKKLVEQFEIDVHDPVKSNAADISEERASVLYLVDSFAKFLIDTDQTTARKARENFDEFAKSLLDPKYQETEKLLFRLRQYFSSYRLEEYTYIQKTFDEFKHIIWDFADQLGDDSAFEKTQDRLVKNNLDELREAVESNSIKDLKNKSREFIDFYIELQTKKENRQKRKIDSVKKNLDSVKKKLLETSNAALTDHLTSLNNRKAFDEYMKRQVQIHKITNQNVSLITLDIDFFKKINDTYGHDIGDFVLKECGKLLKSVFSRKDDFVARIGGEEFAIILPDHQVSHAVKKAEDLIERMRKNVYVTGEHQLRFTASLGIAQLQENENKDQWLKRADQALYQSKNTGRNKYTVSSSDSDTKVA
jgi:diguanylate cyclase